MTATTGLPSITVDRAQLNRLFEAYDEHDVTKILTFFTDDVEWTQPMDGTVIGRDNAERLLNQMFRAMPDLRSQQLTGTSSSVRTATRPWRPGR